MIGELGPQLYNVSIDPVALRSLGALLRRNAGNVGRNAAIAGLTARSAPRRRGPG